jgi:hypothetical protein
MENETTETSTSGCGKVTYVFLFLFLKKCNLYFIEFSICLHQVIHRGAKELLMFLPLPTQARRAIMSALAPISRESASSLRHLA